MRHGAYCDEAVATPSQLVPLPSTFDYAEGATFLAGHGTAYHALIDRGQLAAGRSAAGAWRRRRRRARRGRDRQDAGRHRDRDGVERRKAGDRESEGRRSSRALRPGTVSRRRQAHHRRAGRGCRVRSGRRRGVRELDALHQLGRAAADHRLHRRHRACQNQSPDDQGRQRARRPRRRSGAEKSGARRGQDQGAAGMGGSRKDPPQHLAPAAAGRLCHRRCGC